MERGWAPSLIDRLLGPPDRTAPNPHYRSAAPMKLRRLDRVEAAEATPEFRTEAERAEARRERSRRAAQEAARQRIAEALRAPIADPREAMMDISYKFGSTPRAVREARRLFGEETYDRMVIEFLIPRMMPDDADRLLRPGPGAGIARAVLPFRAARAVARVYPRPARCAMEHAGDFSGMTERETVAAVSAAVPELAHLLFRPPTPSDESHEDITMQPMRSAAETMLLFINLARDAVGLPPVVAPPAWSHRWLKGPHAPLRRTLKGHIIDADPTSLVAVSPETAQNIATAWGIPPTGTERIPIPEAYLEAYEKWRTEVRINFPRLFYGETPPEVRPENDPCPDRTPDAIL